MPHPIFRKAKEDSKAGFVQHVESNETGDDLKQSDWHDADRTLVSYEGGKEIGRNRNHPLLKKHEQDLNEIE